MGNSFRLARVFGVDVAVHWSWVVIFSIMTWLFATGVLEHFYPEWSDGLRWVVGALVAGVFFLSVLAHELSHAVVSNRAGLPVNSITLFVFGGVANLTREPDSPGVEFKIAIVGPLTSLLLGAAFALVWVAARPFSEGVSGVSANLALINASLAVFNMLPGFPLDGGRVFRSIVWARNMNRLRSTRLASRVGEWIAYGVMAVGAVELLFQDYAGLWTLMIGFFLRNAAAVSYEQLVVETTLSGIAVREVMRTDFARIGPEVTLEEFVQESVFRTQARAFAVIAAGDFSGLITLADVRRTPREQWSSTSVYRAMTPASRLHTIGPGDSLSDVLRLMATHDVNQLPVVQGRELIGMLDRGDVFRFIEVRRDLQL